MGRLQIEFMCLKKTEPSKLGLFYRCSVMGLDKAKGVCYTFFNHYSGIAGDVNGT